MGMRPALLLALAAAALAGQTLEFTVLAPAGVKPSGRLDGTIAYDPPGRQLFLFGGQDVTARNDVWVYSVDAGVWRELSPAGDKPAPRFGHTLNYDPVRRRLILFGGQATGFFSDLWAYDIAANRWSQLAPDGAGPSRRYGHSGVYDSVRDRVIVSHGFTDRGRFDDTWAYSLAQSRWDNLSPAGTVPLRRCLHHAAFDRAGNQMFLFGGCASGAGPCPLGDLWSLDLSASPPRWREIRGAPSPDPRQYYGVAFDERRRRLILHGGSGGQVFNDTWEFDPVAGSWEKLGIQAPPPRHRLQGEYAPGVETVFFFGGISGSQPVADLLALAVAQPPLVNAFSQSKGPQAPGALVTLYGAALGPQAGVVASIDPATGRLPEQLAGTSVRVNGFPAPMLYAQAGQLNFQLPYEIPDGPANVEVSVNGAPKPVLTLPVAATAPGLHGAAYRTANVLTLYATGACRTNPPSATGALSADPFPRPAAAITLRLGGREARILFAGIAPGTAGVLQINAEIPEGLALGPAVEAVLRAGEAATTATLQVVE
jgi:uncharacterized protein (TIGR03437 family)